MTDPISLTNAIFAGMGPPPFLRMSTSSGRAEISARDRPDARDAAILVFRDQRRKRVANAGALRRIKANEIGYTCAFELYTPSRRRIGEIGTAFIDVARVIWADGR